MTHEIWQELTKADSELIKGGVEPGTTDQIADFNTGEDIVRLKVANELTSLLWSSLPETSQDKR